MGVQHTKLYDLHVAAGARMTAFAGWSMPLHYGSQIGEHHSVRRAAGMFDVSHMTILDIDGDAALDFLHLVFANDAAKASAGKAVYGVLLNERGGIVDDVIIYCRSGGYRMVANAATHGRVLPWLDEQAAGFDVRIREREDLAMVACQGPRALVAAESALGMDLGHLASFQALEAGDMMIARTGYTGEDGVEVMLPAERAAEFWQGLQAAEVAPAGLAARDTLRLEAGLNLHGQDMDETTTPLESNLAWSIAWQPPERNFIGRQPLARQRASKPAQTLAGVVVSGRGVMRAGSAVETSRGAGVVSSGTFSPTLGYSIGLARLPRGATGDCTVSIRGKPTPGRVVKPPFVRRGKQVFI